MATATHTTDNEPLPVPGAPDMVYSMRNYTIRIYLPNDTTRSAN